MHSVKQAARHLGISASKVYQLATTRKVSHFRVGGKILFQEQDLDAYLASCRITASSPAPATTPLPRRPLVLKHVSLSRSSPRG